MLAVIDNTIHRLRLSDDGSTATLEPLGPIPAHPHGAHAPYAVDSRHRQYAPSGPSTLWVVGKDGREWEVEGLPCRPTALVPTRHRVAAVCGASLCLVDPLPTPPAIEPLTLPWAAAEVAPLAAGFLAIDEGRERVCVVRFDQTFIVVGGLPIGGGWRVAVPPTGGKEEVVVIVGGEGRGHWAIDGEGMARKVDALDRTFSWVAFRPPMAVVLGEDEASIWVRPLLGGESKLIPLGKKIRYLCTESQSDPPESCPVCLGDFDDDSAGVTLDCGHGVHIDCVEACLARADAYLTSGEQISFSMAKCPGGCGQFTRISSSPKCQSIVRRYISVQILASTCVKEYPDKCTDDLLFYVCSKCTQPFFGGLRVCPRMNPSEPKKDPRSLICDNCTPPCAVHPRSWSIHRCHFCCNPAVHRCFGSIFLCARCDAEWSGPQAPTHRRCLGSDRSTCPLPAAHDSDHDVVPWSGCALCLIADGTLRVENIAPPASPP